MALPADLHLGHADPVARLGEIDQRGRLARSSGEEAACAESRAKLGEPAPASPATRPRTAITETIDVGRIGAGQLHLDHRILARQLGDEAGQHAFALDRDQARSPRGTACAPGSWAVSPARIGGLRRGRGPCGRHCRRRTTNRRRRRDRPSVTARASLPSASRVVATAIDLARDAGRRAGSRRGPARRSSPSRCAAIFVVLTTDCHRRRSRRSAAAARTMISRRVELDLDALAARSACRRGRARRA